MPKAKQKSVLSGLTVRDAMRRLVVHLFGDATIAQAIREMIKFKVNAVLVAGERSQALGVVSKTNILGAYYAGLPVSSPLTDIMVAPVLFCGIEEPLDTVLDKMRSHNIHRIYVSHALTDQAVGVVAYPDIIGLLYRFCHRCEKSTIRTSSGSSREKLADHFHVSELMTPSAHECSDTSSLVHVMESLISQRLRTVLIKDRSGVPVGVVSMTDFIIAYLHGLPHEAEVKSIMSSPVRACNQDEPLVMAIQKMIFSDVQNLYVYKKNPRNIVGILSLSEIARVRSGSCRACLVSRIEIDGPK